MVSGFLSCFELKLSLAEFQGSDAVLPNIRLFLRFPSDSWIRVAVFFCNSSILTPQYGVQNQILRLMCVLRIAAQGDARHIYKTVLKFYLLKQEPEQLKAINLVLR